MIIDSKTYNKVSDWICSHPKKDNMSVEDYVAQCKKSLKLPKSMDDTIVNLVKYWLCIDDEDVDENLFS